MVTTKNVQETVAKEQVILYSETNNEANTEDVEDEIFVSSFEKLLESVVPSGVYQWRLIIFLLIPLALFYSVASSSVVLLMLTPQHSCHVPGRSLTNMSLEQWNNITIPWEKGPDGRIQLSKCKMYNVTTLIDSNFTDLYEYNTQNTESLISCKYGWDYDQSKWRETPVTKFDWVCDKKNSVTIVFTLSMAAAAIGTLSLAILSDKFGRKPIFFFTVVLNVVFGLAVIFAPSLVYFGTFKFFSALAYYDIFQLPYIIIIEMCNQRLRSIATTCSTVAFVLSSCYLTLVASLLSDWKMYVLFTQLPIVIFIFYWRFIPESPRWLLSKGKLVECEEVMTKIATVNGTKFTDEMRQLMKKAQIEERKKVPVTKIFSSYVLTKHLLLTGILLSIGISILVSLNLNVHNMRGNVFTNYMFLRLIELPGNLFAIFSCSYLGRRATAVIWPLFAAVSILVASYYVTGVWSLTIAVGLTKMFMKFEIYAVYLQVGELFPTRLRATAYGITGVLGMIGPIASPALIALGSTNAQLPYYILCGLCIAASFISTFLPETLGQPLPQTLKEAKNVGKGQSYFSIITKWNVNKIALELESTKLPE